ncbi:hypothetical protein GGF50DRAFT_58553, partial [Schizophyllum commune]
DISDILAALERATAIVNLELHRNGFRPSVEEVEEIRAQGSILEAHVERIDADIAALTALRSEVASQIDLHRALASPIRRLVPEVLSEIISTTVWSQPRTQNPLPMAIKIASVSSLWRRLARDDPHLWTRAVFVSERQLHFLLDNILPLSRGLPLDLEHGGDKYELYFIVLSSGYAHRLRTLYFPSDFLPDTLPTLSAPLIATNLERLRIILRPHMHNQRSLFDCIKMPHLRDLDVSVVRSQDLRRADQMHLEHLTRLTLNIYSDILPEDILPLLRRCSDTLQRLAIKSTYTHPHAAYPKRFDVVHMPRLSGIDCRAGGHALLWYIVAPQVETLSLTGPLPFFCDALLSFLRRSSRPSRITCLAIYQKPSALDPTWAPSLIQCFELLDALEELHITMTPIPAELVRSLVLRDGVQPLLPRLGSMGLADEEGMSSEVRGVIHEVLASRSRRRIICGRKVVALEDTEAPFGEGDHEWSESEEE